MENKLNEIDKKLAVLISKHDNTMKILERHDKEIRELQKTKYTIYGACLVLSGALSIITACIMRVFL